MKKVIIVSIMAVLTACSQPAQKQEKTNTPAAQNQTVYTCPMHPSVAELKPGTCPKCGMDLVEKQD
jgi:uncharacterized lipoprotein YajG